jgi:Tol biopolymer transport system component
MLRQIAEIFMKRRLFAVALFLVGMLAPASVPAQATEVYETYYKVSTSPRGTLGDAVSSNSKMSVDGRYVVFASAATNLVPGEAADTNREWDIFRKDTLTGEVVRINVDSSGNPTPLGIGTNNTDFDVTADGSKVVFTTVDPLIPEDTNGSSDVYMRDLLAGTTVRVSVGDQGQQANSSCSGGRISPNGSYITFQSWATNLVQDATSYQYRAFHRDVVNNITEILPLPGQGIRNVYGFSYDGSKILYTDTHPAEIPGYPSSTWNYVDVFVLDRATGDAIRANVSSSGEQANAPSGEPSITPDGRYVVYPSLATNLTANAGTDNWDIFVHDMVTGGTELASLNSFGQPANRSVLLHPLISADGRYVAFFTDASNMYYGAQFGVYEAFVHDRQSGQTRRVFFPNQYGFHLGMSSDGKYLTFSNPSPNGVPSSVYGQVYKVSVEQMFTMPAPVAPVLARGTQANATEIQWAPVDGAVYYKVYRNGTLIADEFKGNYFNDTGLPEGTYAYTVSAVDSYLREGTLSAPLTFQYDLTVPSVDQVALMPNPLLQGQNTTLTVTASDAFSGVSKVVYEVNGAAPQPMTYDSASGTWKATFGSDLPVNTYDVAVTAIDAVGNMSPSKVDVLAVYSGANGYVTGHEWLVPAGKDILPIARDTSTNNPAKLVVGFTNVKAATSTTPTTGSFDVHYVVKNNQDEFDLSSTSVDWLVVPDSTDVSMLGHADLTKYVNGVKTVIQNVAVRFDLVLGMNGAADHVSMKIYSPGVDPNTGTPSWRVNDYALLNVSQMMIKQ